MQVLPFLGFWLKHGSECEELLGGSFNPSSTVVLLEVLHALAPIAKQQWPQRAELLDDFLATLEEALG